MKFTTPASPPFETVPDTGIGRPFFLGSLSWLVLGLSILKIVRGAGFSWAPDLGWFFAFFLLSHLNLVAMIGFFRTLLPWMADAKSQDLGSIYHLFFWGTLKLGCLGLLIMILFSRRAIPNISLLLGLSTLWMVPLLGGLFWHRKQSSVRPYQELRDASGTRI